VSSAITDALGKCKIERFTVYTHVAIYIDWISLTVRDSTSTDVTIIGNGAAGTAEVEESDDGLENIKMYCNYELLIDLDK